MNTRACEETDGAKRCSTSRLLRSSSNIVCVSPKNFEIYSLECVKFVSERYEYDDIPWISERLKKPMAPKDAAHHTCLHHVQKSYPHRRIIFLSVPLGSGCTECSNACEITSFPYTCGRRAVQEQPRTAACSDHAYWSRCRSTRWCTRRRLHDLRPSGAPPRTGRKSHKCFFCAFRWRWMSEVRALVKHCVFHIIWPSDYLKFRCPLSLSFC